MNNDDIRQMAASNRINLWQIAQELGITDSTFSRVLRKELTPEKKEEIREIINRLSKEKTETYSHESATIISKYKRTLKDAVNELCYQCGQYKQEHKGACDGCRWRGLRSGDIG